jgi:hypothetical protein
MKRVIIDCSDSSKKQINEEIKTKTLNSNNIELVLSKYEHDTLESIILPNNGSIITLHIIGKLESFVGLKLPNSLLIFNCFGNQITSFEGLILPPSLTEFSCSGNQITSFTGLTLKSTDDSGDSSLTEFYCSNNKITSFAGLTLPNSLTIFDCHSNKITSFAKLTLPPRITDFNCSDNEITDFSEFKLNPDDVRNSLKVFNCSYNRITSLSGLNLSNSLLENFYCYGNIGIIIQDFIFPSTLIELAAGDHVKFINPRFNSVLVQKLENEVDFDTTLDHNNLIFLYLNFRFDEHQVYDRLLSLIK